MKHLILLIIVTFYNVTISAQVSNLNNESTQIMEAKAFISNLKKSNQTSRNSSSKAQNVENLLYKLQPSVYLKATEVNTYGENPTNLYVEISSLNRINNAAILKDNIEIVTIKINTLSELNSTIDLSVFSSFDNLKYIYIICTVPTTNITLSKMIVNYNEKYGIIYTIDKGA